MEPYKVDLPKSNFKEKKKVVKKSLKEATLSYNNIYNSQSDIIVLILYMASKIKNNPVKLGGFIADAVAEALTQAEQQGFIINADKVQRYVIKNLYNNTRNDSFALKNDQVAKDKSEEV